MAAAHNESGSNVKGLRGCAGWKDFQLTSPPSGQSQLKAVTRGQSQLKSRYTGAKVNWTSSPQLNQREQPTALQGMPAMPAMPAMHLRRAQPCRRRLCRRAPSRTHALSHAALPSRKHPVSCWPRLTSHTPPLRHLAISPSHHPAPRLWQRDQRLTSIRPIALSARLRPALHH